MISFRESYKSSLCLYLNLVFYFNKNRVALDKHRTPLCFFVMQIWREIMGGYFMEEIWKGLIYQGKDYSNKIEISNTGKIRNKNTKKEYKLYKNKLGYLQVCISLGSRNNKKVIKIHKGVAETFINNSNNYEVVNHIDLNKLNNNINNLEWCTQKYNMKHAKLNGAFKNMPKGIDHYKSKLTKEDVDFIRKNYKPRDKKYGSRALGRKFNMRHSTILLVIKEMTYKNIIF